MILAASCIRKNGRADVDGEHAVEEFGRRIEDRAAIGHAGSVHQDVDPSEDAVGTFGDVASLFHVGEVGRHELGRAPLGADLGRDRLAALRRSARR